MGTHTEPNGTHLITPLNGVEHLGSINFFLGDHPINQDTLPHRQKINPRGALALFRINSATAYFLLIMIPKDRYFKTPGFDTVKIRYYGSKKS
jgi:hypothetical protein